MSKLSNIVKNLSEENYYDIRETLVRERAEKSVYLLQSIRENDKANEDVMQNLKLNTNAYYTLRSRLGQKIEDYLLSKVQHLTTDLSRKVSNIGVLVFTEKRTIVLTTLKKLEKELIRYNLYSDLSSVYKYLKKFYANTEEAEQYKEKDRRYARYGEKIEKSEQLLADYFSLYAHYYLEGKEEDKEALNGMEGEMKNLYLSYDFSHKLYVYYTMVASFHRLYVQMDSARPLDNKPLEPLENVFQRIEGYFTSYPHDPLYGHLAFLVDYLRLCYYTQYGIYDKAEEYGRKVEKEMPRLLTNYGFFTFPAHVLTITFQRSLWGGDSKHLVEKNQVIFGTEGLEGGAPMLLCFVAYEALCLYADKQHRRAAFVINRFFNESHGKEFPRASLELKCLLALQYVMLDEYELFVQIANSIQRHFRLLGKERVGHLVVFVKILKTAMNGQKSNKAEKIGKLIQAFSRGSNSSFCPLSLIQMDDNFVRELCEAQGFTTPSRKH